jgi:hypothetical protein
MLITDIGEVDKTLSTGIAFSSYPHKELGAFDIEIDASIRPILESYIPFKFDVIHK